MKFSVDTKHVSSDLIALQAFDINAYGRAAALIQELYQNQHTSTVQNLLDQWNMQGRELNISEQLIGQSLRIQYERLKRDLWRLKFRRICGDRQILEPYRFIYGFYPVGQYRKAPEIRLFAVPCRAHEKDDSYDYEPDHPISIRVRNAYDADE